MPVTNIGPRCHRFGCTRPIYHENLCVPCWHLARLFSIEPERMAADPLDSEKGWMMLESEAKRAGMSLADYIAQKNVNGQSDHED